MLNFFLFQNMKKILILFFVLACADSAIAQRSAVFNDTIMIFNRQILKTKLLTPQFKKIASRALNAEDDCTIPPGCDIVNPWTCECESGLKDPWGSKVQADRLAAFQSFEKAIQSGGGKKILPPSLVATAHKKYPGTSAKALHYRTKFYMNSMR